MSLTNEVLKSQDRLMLSFCRTSCKLPLVAYNIRMEMFGKSTQAPTNWFTFSWEISRTCFNSRRISLSFKSMFDFSIRLMATNCPCRRNMVCQKTLLLAKNVLDHGLTVSERWFHTVYFGLNGLKKPLFFGRSCFPAELPRFHHRMISHWVSRKEQCYALRCIKIERFCWQFRWTNWRSLFNQCFWHLVLGYFGEYLTLVSTDAGFRTSQGPKRWSANLKTKRTKIPKSLKSVSMRKDTEVVSLPPETDHERTESCRLLLTSSQWTLHKLIAFRLASNFSLLSDRNDTAIGSFLERDVQRFLSFFCGVLNSMRVSRVSSVLWAEGTLT